MRRALGFLLLLSAPAFAQTSDPSEGRNGDFGGKLLVTTDLNRFWTEWNKPDNPTIETTSRVTQSQPVYSIVLFHDCKAGPDGNCKVLVRFTMTAPDGKPYDEPHENVAWTAAPPPNHNIQASRASMGFILEAQDKLGRYEIEAKVTDEISGRSITLRQYVTAEAESAGAAPTT